MADLRAKFVKILKAELEDLLEDVDVAERLHAERFARREVTDYVYRQNDALFRSEEESLRRILDLLSTVEPARYPDLGTLVSAIDAQVKHVVRDHEEPGAIYQFVCRKLRKVRLYVESSSEP
jgi:hypothetical protein